MGAYIMFTCEECKTPFFRSAERNTQKHCSVECQFWSKVIKSGPDECWLWTGANVRNYGVLRCDGISLYATHVSYVIAYGRLSDGLLMCHRCDNPPCVNPAHLFPGTDADNMDDMYSKGRKGSTKLTDEQLRYLVSIYKTDSWKPVALAKQLGVARHTITRIFTRRGYKHRLQAIERS